MTNPANIAVEQTALANRPIIPDIPTITKLLKQPGSNWTTDYQAIITSFAARKEPLPTRGKSIIRTVATIGHCFPDAKPETRQLLEVMLQGLVHRAGIADVDLNVTLIPLAQSLEPVMRLLEQPNPLGESVQEKLKIMEAFDTLAKEMHIKVDELPVVVRELKEYAAETTRDNNTLRETAEKYKDLNKQAKADGLTSADEYPAELAKRGDTTALETEIAKLQRAKDELRRGWERINELDDQAHKQQLISANAYPSEVDRLKTTNANQAKDMKALQTASGELAKLTEKLMSPQTDLLNLTQLDAESTDRNVAMVIQLLAAMKAKMGDQAFADVQKKAAEAFNRLIRVTVGETFKLPHGGFSDGYLNIRVTRKIGGGADGEVYLAEAETPVINNWDRPTEPEPVILKLGKNTLRINNELMTLAQLGGIQQKAGLADNQYAPGYKRKVGKSEGFAQDMIVMERVPGQDIPTILDEMKQGRQPLTDTEVASIFRQVTHLGSIIETSATKHAGSGGDFGQTITMARDMEAKSNRIFYDPATGKAKVIDWSVGCGTPKQIAEETTLSIKSFANWMSRLMGSETNVPPENTNPDLKKIIAKCQTGNPPYANFTELYEDLNKFAPAPKQTS